ncbi:hypothetical protein OG937_06595 [Streptomyces sp. NBC_00510]
MTTPLNIADRQVPGRPFTHFWNTCIGAGRAAEGLRATWQEHLRTGADAAGFRHARSTACWTTTCSSTGMLMNRLGGELLAQTGGAVVTRDSSDGRLSALVYHCPPEVSQAPPGSFGSREVAERTPATGVPRLLSIDLSGLPPGAAVAISALEQDHGNALRRVEGHGRAAESVTRKQAQALREAACATGHTVRYADGTGRFAFQEAIAPWSVLLFSDI